ncbi:NFX1-type zinc finger-containing protein 1-like [Achroia grisella]|uniref:NFX1-type zinc finger-containing protein 1-like n=1 Tax=Achroia grisella TaxID=688607 RepID=UPI0027D2462A|nr:NFX1-type zinc finger-containing protein 1-like [Achroia grisella]XP_059049960.1 NFX1-type zinc finger-containing protein 1-like [Achroia grisella]XP_059049968.1 NFX1-type zinc finger-containing protein 1-like [Achroia grisella]
MEDDRENPYNAPQAVRNRYTRSYSRDGGEGSSQLPQRRPSNHGTRGQPVRRGFGNIPHVSPGEPRRSRSQSYGNQHVRDDQRQQTHQNWRGSSEALRGFGNIPHVSPGEPRRGRFPNSGHHQVRDDQRQRQHQNWRGSSKAPRGFGNMPHVLTGELSGGSSQNSGYHHFHDDQGQQAQHRRGSSSAPRDRHVRMRKNPLETLQEITNSDDVLAEINDKKKFFENLFKTSTQIQNIFVLVIEILSKASESSFNDLKLKMILIVGNPLFISQFRNYLMDLPYQDESKSRNQLYWKNPINFWRNLLKFLECIINLSPSTAVRFYRPLINYTIKQSLEELIKMRRFSLPEEYSNQITQLQNKLTEWETKHLIQTQSNTHEENEPPEDFRIIPIIPNRHHLMRPPFLRPNIINGAYKDVDHYLDIQFRLMLEDCYGPLRKGLIQYLENSSKGKYDNIRVYNNVKFLSPYVSNSKIGLLVEIDKYTNRYFFKTNWKSSKRLLFGSLLLLSKDGFKNFAVATVIDRDINYLSKGQLPIAMVNINVQLKPGDTYTMIESDVYFEPYHHVLTVLQNPNFPEKLTMQKYIVKVEASFPPPPVFVNNATAYNVNIIKTNDNDNAHINLGDNDCIITKKFYVLHDDTWPTAKELGLNISQYEAYKLALTHEIAVIQGPPGTGKTFLGVKIAETLLKNSTNQILVICYTNHALDQFLEHILKFTTSIVRIGGQSRNEALSKYNINKLRTTRTRHTKHETVYYEQKRTFNVIVSKLKKLHDTIQNLKNGILAYDTIKILEPDSTILSTYYQSDPLQSWLFEHITYVKNTEDIEESVEIVNNVDDDIYQRTELNLDDEDIFADNANQNIENLNFTLSFSLMKAQKNLKYWKSQKEIKGKSQNYYEQLEDDIMMAMSSIALFNDMKKRAVVNRTVIKLNETNVKQMPSVERWRTYFSWIENIAAQLNEQVSTLQIEYETERKVYEDARMYFDLLHMVNARVIGITTTGAARLQKMLQVLETPIVIVEEAAEVLEQHIVASLSGGCQHLILIGDHQQLRPSAAYMKLAKHYDLEVSLFERMIRNNIPNRRLGVQHRMRPEIASLIVPHIYPDLKNHPSVNEFLPVRGMAKNLFFFTHDHKEQETDDSMSRTNHKEADLALGLANYLMQQDYKPEDVTILAAYSGQMFYMRKQRSSYHFLSQVKITVVDNYQGEESKIIILSLVRNNIDNKIGFLSTENRVCVALSRAREGMYIFGNIDILTNNSELWRKIGTTLESNGSLGYELKLVCDNHLGRTTTISKVEDFEKSPEGGCLLNCSFRLKCGHECPRICHAYDRAHLDTICSKMCERIICELEHACPLPCKDECKKCIIPVEKRLPCGHDQVIPCWQDPNESVKCNTINPVILPHCGHKVQKYCHIKIEQMICPVKCVYRIESCGHVCNRNCHVKDDPDHEKYLCEKPCAKAKAGCSASLLGDRGNHQCLKQCHETCDDCTVEVKKKRSKCTHTDKVACSVNIDNIPCRKKCTRTLPCGHHCKNKCFEECGNCDVMVTKIIPECGHKIKIECRKEATRIDCLEKCNRHLGCGHVCPGRCNAACDPTKCTVLVSHNYKSWCGHTSQLPCNVLKKFIDNGARNSELLMVYCTVPCEEMLECEHICSGTCSQCYQGRVHRSCHQTCERQNICGHRCAEPCNKLCPPCKMKCDIKCPHSKCSKPCGAPCTPCQENCTRSCFHSACSNRCGEKCNRAPCEEKCPLQLPCGHRCRGLCGERCPDICAYCSPDTFPTDFLGDEYDEDAKFIQLEDCAHVIEVEDMDNLMMGDSDTIDIRTCPFCRKPIINTQRYKDLIRHMIVTDINPIKNQVFGSTKDIDKKRTEILGLIDQLRLKYQSLLSDNEDYQTAFKAGKLISKTASLLDFNMTSIYFEILDIMGEYYMRYKTNNLSEFKEEVLGLIKLLCNIMSSNRYKISRQQQNDIGNELNRLNSLIGLAQITHHSNYLTLKKHPRVIQALELAKNSIITRRVFNYTTAQKAVKELQQILKSDIITAEERGMVIKAMNMKAGHWYKCPNGHYYCIGECGGAMQLGNCIECGEQIGGQSHRLLSSNKHAGEIDGSKFAAWSEQYNDMRNFQYN